MPLFFQNNTHTVGNTPLVRLHNLGGSQATVLAKIEGRNPAFSIKDRVALAMLDHAELHGILHPGMTLVEPTSGNTGIGLAFAAALRGYKCILTMPETMSIERRRVLKMLGAELVLTKGSEGMAGAINYAEKLIAENSESYYMPQQFKNPANPAAHEATTGPEILKDTEGQIDVLVAGVGTGGTITGISRFFKRKCNKPILSIAVEPAASPVLTQHRLGQELCPGPHKIQGIGAGFIPETLDLALIDRIETVTDEEAIDFAKRLAKSEGILAGISSGAACAVACRLAREAAFHSKVIVCILPDAGERYMSSDLYTTLD